MEQSDHAVVMARRDNDLDRQLRRWFRTLRAWGFASKYKYIAAAHRSQVKDTILWEVERGSKLTGEDVSRAIDLRWEAWNLMRLFLDKYEYYILPTTQVPPFDINLPYPREIEGAPMADYVEWMKSCYLISILETPAISVPCGFTQEGLPVGLQIVGRHRAEWSVLQLAHAFEQASGGFKRPSICSTR